MTEVKSSSSQKEEHLADAAVQVHVLNRSGIDVRGVDIMHLNKECHFPDLSNLFERTDVTAAVEPLLGKIGWEIDAQLAMLAGRCPTSRSASTASSRTSALHGSLLAQRLGPHHPALQRGRQKGLRHMLTGVNKIGDLPATQKLQPPRNGRSAP